MKKSMIQTKTFLLAALWLWCVGMWAIPARQRPFIVTNSDGTQLTLVLRGDESFHFYTTLDGVPAVQDETGDWHVRPELADSIQTTWAANNQRRNAHRTRRMAQRRTVGKNSSYTGKKKGLVILVNFQGKSMKSTSTPEKFSQRFNQEGYKESNHYGSVHDYFYDQSYGVFDLTFDVVGPVEASQSMAYYGENNANNEDKYVATLAAEVCTSANERYDINWADYDWDGDMEVDQVYIIYAGYGESAGASKNTIWPHEWTLTEGKSSGDGKGPIQLKGYTIDTYAMSCELAGTYGSTMDGIGTACHEFSHCLGLPDFYDTSYAGGFGMSAWDVMDGGCYNGARYIGECPSGFTAYERWFTGWLTPITLDSPISITQMPCLHDEPIAYIIYNDNNKNEYFMLENRQRTGWFQYTEDYTTAHGMLAYHVDYDEDAWINNEPNNNDGHQRMSIIPAGGIYGTYIQKKGYYTTEQEFCSQLFPGNKTVTELTNTSHTATNGKLFHKNTDGTLNMNKPITHITETDGLISFDFMGGDEANGIAAPACAVAETDAPQHYNLQGQRVAPTDPGIHIVRQAGGTRKVLVR